MCDEFIDLMSNAVLKCIVKEIKTAKYFSIIVDSTSDVKKIDLLTVAAQYIRKGSSPVEKYIGFRPLMRHKSQEMQLELLRMFKKLGH